MRTEGFLILCGVVSLLLQCSANQASIGARGRPFCKRPLQPFPVTAPHLQAIQVLPQSMARRAVSVALFEFVAVSIVIPRNSSRRQEEFLEEYLEEGSS